MDGKTIYSRFAEWVGRRPDETAIAEDGRSVTYRELDEMANSIMSKFYAWKFDAVGIVMEHGIEMIAAMLAVLKSGAAYVPAEPALPEARIDYMMRTAGANFVITDDYCRNLPAVSPLPGRSVPDGVAYVLYTSGTSGRPKGVVVENYSVVNYAEAFEHEFHVAPGDVMLQYSICSFDIFVEEVFTTLLNGATLAIPSREVHDGSLADLMAFCERHGVTEISGFPYLLGAGKTLVGLDVAVKQSYNEDGLFNENDGAVYLSGNGPLVTVLTEALARDNYKKAKDKEKEKKLSDSRREVKKFIQIIHQYRDNMLAKIKNPVVDGKLEIDPEKAVKLQQSGYGEVEHVAIFDESQRAWTHQRIANYLKRGGTYGNKLKVPNFPMSEAAFLIWSLDQREDWATIVCLIGGGQEINTGEAGISEWIIALNNLFPHW